MPVSRRPRTLISAAVALAVLAMPFGAAASPTGRAAAVPDAPAARVGAHAHHHHHRPPGRRIVALARSYVGKVRYIEGGATPKQGFDCSGYTAWVYSHSDVARLPHNAERQRHARGMHRETRRQARPGDLVFYLSGGRAYHVAIYAGHGMQFAAATPTDGLVHQPIWSRHVQFRTDWHHRHRPGR